MLLRYIFKFVFSFNAAFTKKFIESNYYCKYYFKIALVRNRTRVFQSIRPEVLPMIVEMGFDKKILEWVPYRYRYLHNVQYFVPCSGRTLFLDLFSSKEFFLQKLKEKSKKPLPILHLFVLICSGTVPVIITLRTCPYREYRYRVGT